MNGKHIGLFVFCAALAGCGALAPLWEWKALSWVLILAASVGAGWVILDSQWDRYNTSILYREGLVKARTQFAMTIATADPETRYFLAQEWPELGVEFGEEKIVYVLKDGVNTQVLVSFLRLFLEDSTAEHFVDLRRYNEDKTLQERFGVSREVVRKQWHFATTLLEKDKYLRAGTMAGNRTWQWASKDHYKRMMRRYGNMRSMENLG